MENEIKNNQAQSIRPIVGIDLGTTNSAVAYIHKGKSKIMTNNDGKRYIPSVVLIDPSGKVIVGENARSALIDRKSTRLNSSHVAISYAVFCLKKKIKKCTQQTKTH